MKIEIILLFIKLICLCISFYLVTVKIFPKFSNNAQNISSLIGLISVVVLFYLSNSFLSIMISLIVTSFTLLILELLFITNKLYSKDIKEQKEDNSIFREFEPLSSKLSYEKLKILYEKFRQFEIINEDVTLDEFDKSFLQKIMKLKNLTLAELSILYDFLYYELKYDLSKTQFCTLMSLKYDSFKSYKNRIKNKHIDKMKILLNF